MDRICRAEALRPPDGITIPQVAVAERQQPVNVFAKEERQRRARRPHVPTVSSVSRSTPDAARAVPTSLRPIGELIQQRGS
jgi:hypothetical protein